MTWVIGRPGIFGYAVGISDIRVTLEDGTEKDCLQKVYRVGRNLALGFAGSVKIGLTIVEQIAAVLYETDHEAVWNPLQVAETLHKSTRPLFDSFPVRERDLGCHLILLSAHPTQRDGAAPWHRCYVHRFYSPDFQAVPARAGEIVSIGSGATLPHYAEALRKLESDFDVLKLEAHMPGASALGYMMYLTSAIESNPQPGISPHLQVFLVDREGIKVGANDRTVQDHPEENFVLPPLAHNWDEFCNLLGTSDANLELATC